MPDFEATFRTRPLTEPQEDLVSDVLGGMVGGHGDVTLVTLDLPGESGESAGHAMARTLTENGIEVIGVHPDLVTRGVIAERCKETRQAVGNWIRGDRLAASPFPSSFNLVGGGVWRWQEVNDWLRDQGKNHDTDVGYLTWQDEVAVDYALCAERRPSRVS